MKGKTYPKWEAVEEVMGLRESWPGEQLVLVALDPPTQRATYTVLDVPGPQGLLNDDLQVVRMLDAVPAGNTVSFIHHTSGDLKACAEADREAALYLVKMGIELNVPITDFIVTNEDGLLSLLGEGLL